MVSKAYGKWKSDFLNKHLETQYKTLNKAYKTNCKHAKREKQQSIISSLQEFGETSKYYKELISDTTYDIGVLQTPTSETKPGKDTIKHLYETHFPAHTKPKKPTTNHFK